MWKERYDRELKLEARKRYINRDIVKDKGEGYFGPLKEHHDPSDLKRLEDALDKIEKELQNGK